MSVYIPEGVDVVAAHREHGRRPAVVVQHGDFLSRSQRLLDRLQVSAARSLQQEGRGALVRRGALARDSLLYRDEY